MSERRTFRGFTLVELLVVVAILSLLLAMLMPTFARSKALAERANCASFRHQFLVGMGAYATQNRGSFLIDKTWCPHWRDAPAFDHFTQRYLGGQDWIWDCPTWSYHLAGVRQASSKIWSGGTHITHGSLYVAGKAKMAGNWLTLGSEWYSPMGVQDPGDWAVIGCRIERTTPMSATAWSTTIVHGPGPGKVRWTSFNTPIDQAGNEGGNVGYADGSAKWIDVQQLKPHLANNGTEYYW